MWPRGGPDDRPGRAAEPGSSNVRHPAEDQGRHQPRPCPDGRGRRLLPRRRRRPGPAGTVEFRLFRPSRRDHRRRLLRRREVPGDRRFLRCRQALGRSRRDAPGHPSRAQRPAQVPPLRRRRRDPRSRRGSGAPDLPRPGLGPIDRRAEQAHRRDHQPRPLGRRPDPGLGLPGWVGEALGRRDEVPPIRAQGWRDRRPGPGILPRWPDADLRERRRSGRRVGARAGPSGRRPGPTSNRFQRLPAGDFPGREPNRRGGAGGYLDRPGPRPRLQPSPA